MAGATHNQWIQYDPTDMNKTVIYMMDTDGVVHAMPATRIEEQALTWLVYYQPPAELLAPGEGEQVTILHKPAFWQNIKPLSEDILKEMF